VLAHDYEVVMEMFQEQRGDTTDLPAFFGPPIIGESLSTLLAELGQADSGSGECARSEREVRSRIGLCRVGFSMIPRLRMTCERDSNRGRVVAALHSVNQPWPTLTPAHKDHRTRTLFVEWILSG
jgi:hypothetical protein